MKSTAQMSCQPAGMRPGQSQRTGCGVAARIVANSRVPSAGEASASMTTTPSRVTMNPALGLPSDPRPVSPRTAKTPGASSRAAKGRTVTVSAAAGDGASA